MAQDFDNVALKGEARRGLPSANADAITASARFLRYMEQAVGKLAPRLYADEGTYFMASNATPGTGLAGHAAPTDVTSVLKPLVQVKNGSSASADKRIQLMYIKLVVTAAGTNGTNCIYAEEVDDVARYTSGGTQLTPVCSNMAASSPSSSDIVIFAGAIVAPAAGSNARKIGSGTTRTSIPVVGDTYIYVYGQEYLTGVGLALNGTTPSTIVVLRPPVILGPGMVFNHHQAQAAQSAASSFEVEVHGILR